MFALDGRTRAEPLFHLAAVPYLRNQLSREPISLRRPECLRNAVISGPLRGVYADTDARPSGTERQVGVPQ